MERRVEAADRDVDLSDHRGAAFAEWPGQALQIAEIAVGRVDRRADALHGLAEVGDHLGQGRDRVLDVLAGRRIAHHVVDVLHGGVEGVESGFRLPHQLLEAVVSAHEHPVHVDREFLHRFAGLGERIEGAAEFWLECREHLHGISGDGTHEHLVLLQSLPWRHDVPRHQLDLGVTENGAGDAGHFVPVDRHVGVDFGDHAHATAFVEHHARHAAHEDAVLADGCAPGHAAGVGEADLDRIRGLHERGQVAEEHDQDSGDDGGGQHHHADAKLHHAVVHGCSSRVCSSCSSVSRLPARPSTNWRMRGSRERSRSAGVPEKTICDSSNPRRNSG